MVVVVVVVVVHMAVADHIVADHIVVDHIVVDHIAAVEAAIHIDLPSVDGVDLDVQEDHEHQEELLLLQGSFFHW